MEFVRHSEARKWWEDQMNGDGSVGLGWVALLGFIRITTNSRILSNPLSVSGASLSGKHASNSRGNGIRAMIPIAMNCPDLRMP